MKRLENHSNLVRIFSVVCLIIQYSFGNQKEKRKRKVKVFHYSQTHYSILLHLPSGKNFDREDCAVHVRTQAR